MDTPEHTVGIARGWYRAPSAYRYTHREEER
jgi:hypothetical protein